jgi:protein-tyrosine phosphatase
MIDVHCHLLPNLDDGSRSVAQSVEVLTRFAAEGVTAVILTPHITASRIASDAEPEIVRRGEALDLVRHAVPAPRLHTGFEIMLDAPFPESAARDRRFSLAESRYYLVEFPTTIVAELTTSALRRMTRLGIIPIVAHPERYIACTTGTVAGWRELGCRVQVDATTLTRRTPRGERARALVRRGLADVLAADNHGDRRSLGTAVRFLEQRDGSAAAGWLTEQNPQAIVEDRDMMPVPTVEISDSFGDRIQDLWKKISE